MFVWNVTAAQAGMYSVEIAPASSLFAKPLDYFIQDIMFVELIGSVFRQSRYSGLGRIPIAVSIQVQISGPITQAAKGIAKGSYRFSWLYAP
jgi:hypothetical protein